MRVLNSFLITLLVIMLAASSCKKDKNDSLKPYVGTWQVATDTFSHYWVIGSNGVIHELSQAFGGIRSDNQSIYKEENNTLLVNSTLYAYRLSGDSLVLSKSDQEIILIKHADVNPDGWVKQAYATTISSLPANSLYLGALEWTGAEFLLSNFNKKVYLLTPAGQVTDSTTLLNKTVGICMHNSEFWTCAPTIDNKLRKVNLVTGTETFLSSAFTSPVVAPASDGTYIWCISATGELVYYNPVTDAFTVKSQLFPPGFPVSSGAVSDMAIKDGYAYIASYIIGMFKIDLSTGVIVDTYKILPETGPAGLAYNGNQLYGTGINSGGLALFGITF